MSRGRLIDVLEQAEQSSAPLELLGSIGNEPITTPAEARAVVSFFNAFRERYLTGTDDDRRSLAAAVGLFQQVESQAAFAVLASEGLPLLRAIFDKFAAGGLAQETIVFLAKIFALYHQDADLPRVARAVRESENSENFLWAVVFNVLAEEGHPGAESILTQLARPLPTGFAAVAYLDFVNAVLRRVPRAHPFDTEEGHALLETYLTESDPEQFSKAISAAAALSFLGEPARTRLLALGLDHSSPAVQLEAATVSARLGSRAGVAFLARACLDVRTSATAVERLEQLGELNAIPARAKDPGFMAVAELCRWLAHPMEFARPPDSAELFDSRVLHWPPTGEEQRVWLVKYRFEAREETPAIEGIGMVGSITFALFGETTAAMPPEDVYALHCCWELEANEDARAPHARSIAAGRTLLKAAGNSEF